MCVCVCSWVGGLMGLLWDWREAVVVDGKDDMWVRCGGGL